jgi:hypothetical protein
MKRMLNGRDVCPFGYILDGAIGVLDSAVTSH